MAAQAAERGASIVGVDIAESMISLARRLHPELEFRHGDVAVYEVRVEADEIQFRAPTGL